MRRLVHPRNPSSDSPFVLIGEAPGRDEDRSGIAFTGKSGRMLDHYLYLAGITDPHLTNMSRHWPGPGDPDPTRKDLERYWPMLLEELDRWWPEVICTLGAVATRWFLGDVDMDVVHGIPHRSDMWPSSWIVPCYHPAAGLRDPYAASYCQADLQEAARVQREGIVLNRRDSFATDYREYSNALGVHNYAEDALALDTEGVPGRRWGYSACQVPGVASVCRPQGEPHVCQARRLIFHHALYDLPALSEMGVVLLADSIDDTMVMAYILQLEPQGLKALARRHLGMEMQDFRELVAPYYNKAVASYLQTVAAREWPTPDDLLVQDSKTGAYRVKRPQGLQKRAKGILRAMESTKPRKTPLDPRRRWLEAPAEVRGAAEAELGSFPDPGDIGLVPVEEAVQYAGRDADATRQLYPILLRKLQSQGLERVYQMDMAVLPMVSEMMSNGMPVDLKHLHDLGPKLDAEMSAITGRVQKEYNGGRHINLRSGDQVAELLYKRIGLKPPRMTDSGARGKTDEKALQTLALTTPHPVLAEIVKYREVATLQSSFVDKLPRHVGVDGKVHTTIRMTRVVTGRLSTADPNMQAIPAHSELGKEVRNGFYAPPGYLLTSHDLSQIEMVWMAVVSGDREMIELFNSGKDIHDASASKIFQVPLEKVDRSVMRLPAKRVGFGIINGLQAAGLLDQLYLAGINAFDKSDCEGFIRNWLDGFPGVQEFMEECRREGRRQGYVQDYWGRIRYLPNIRCPIPHIAAEEERASHSMKIQGGAQGLMKRGMARIWEQILEWRKDGIDVRPLLQVHDELVCMIPEWTADLVVPRIQELMEADSPMFPVAIHCKGVAGQRWGELKD